MKLKEAISIADNKSRQDVAYKYGKRIGRGIVKKYKDTPISVKGKIYGGKGLETDEASSAIAEILYNCYMEDQIGDCGKLLLEWTQEKLWGKVVLQSIPRLKTVWQYLHDNKHTKNNTLGYGDIDGSIWVEYPKQLNEWPDKRKLIIHTSHCTCADDNTHIFILNTESSFIHDILHVRTVWPRQNSRGGYKVKKTKKNPKGWFSWGDDRDIKRPSLNTYRKRNFEYSYQDGRDRGYVLSLKYFGTPKIEWAHIHQSKIHQAIWLIDLMEDIVTDARSGQPPNE
jgi:hypothetical protein